jgi:chlorite dismutase
MAPTEVASDALPSVPLTLEGASVLHQMMKIKWPAWKALDPGTQTKIVDEAAEALARMETNATGQSAVFSQLGHKGDLMLIHFRRSFDELNEAEYQLNRLRLFDYLEQSHSYLSIVELGLYESTGKTYAALSAKGLTPHTPEWNAGVQEVLDRQKEAMRPRLYPDVPPYKYVCFYPMDRRRGETKNWYMLPLPERARQTHDHGMVGRRYAGEVKQIISTSVGFDDWEWGVDLFSADPLKFKKLIYEMRFDPVSAEYALFGSFFVGIRVEAAALAKLLVAH